MFELECNQVAGSSRVTHGIQSCIAVHVLGMWWGVSTVLAKLWSTE